MNPTTWPDGTRRSTDNDFNWRGPSVIDWGRIKTERQMLLDATRENQGQDLGTHGKAIATSRSEEIQAYKRDRFARSPKAPDNAGAKTFLEARQLPPFIKMVESTVRYAGNVTRAAKLLNVADNTLFRLLGKGKLTSGMAHRIVASHKLIAHHLS
jgi:hypothetical protein